jgi:hypothetical protein
MAMIDREHLDATILKNVADNVGKLAEQCLPNLAICDRVNFRRMRNSLEDLL